MSSFSKSPSPSDEDDVELRRGPWTLDEDTLLIRYIASHGEGRWNLLAKSSGLRRTGKSCRLRWLNYLKPDVKRGNLTPQEQLLILQLHFKWGNRWSKIAQHLPGRTDNEIKNYWRTRVQKQARHLKIDSSSTAFQDLIRTCWMPRLLQKIEMVSPPPSHNIANNHHPLEYHSSPPAPVLPPQVHSHPQEPLNNIGETMLCSLDHPEKSSCSSTSSEYQTSLFHAIGNTSDYNTTINDFNYYVNNNGYDMESLNLASVATSGDYGNPAGDLHVVEHNWVDDDFTDSLWNMDELWQFRQS